MMRSLVRQALSQVTSLVSLPETQQSRLYDFMGQCGAVDRLANAFDVLEGHVSIPHNTAHSIALQLQRMALAYAGRRQPSHRLKICPATIQAIYDRGSALFKQGCDGDAADVFLLCVYLHDDSPALWQALGMAEQRCGRWHEALHAYQRALDLSVDDPMVRFYAAQCSEKLGQRAAAQELCRRALQEKTLSQRAKERIIHFLRQGATL